MTTNALAPSAPVMAMGSLTDPAELGRVLAASGYFQDVREAAQAVVKVLAGAELGFGPIASMTGVYIVKGRVTLSANLMAATIKRHPAYDYRVRTLTNDRADVVYLDTAKACPTCEGTGAIKGNRCDPCAGSGLAQHGSSEFTIEMARNAGLAGGENWRKYPSNMLFARALSNGAKWFCPDAFSGAPVYTPDELGADVDGATGEVIDAVQLTTPMAAPVTRPSSVPPSGAESAISDAPDTPADRPGDASENAAPPAPAAAEPAEEPAPPPEGEGNPHADLADLLERIGKPEATTMARMALIGYNAASFSDLTDAQAREVMGRVVNRFGGVGHDAA